MQETLTNQEKYDNLCKLYKAARDEGLPNSLQMQLLCAILKLGPKVNHYNQDKFKKYVNFMHERAGGGNMMTKLKQGVQSYMDPHYESDWSHILNNVCDTSIHNMSETTNLFLDHICYTNNGSLKDYFQYKEHLSEHRLKNIEDQTRISLSKTGLKGLKLNKKIEARQYKQICDLVHMKFLPENSDKFKVKEEVELWLEVKNVQKVHYKVFEFNTLTYYRKTLKPFDTGIDLDGLDSEIGGQRDVVNDNGEPV